MLHPPMTGTYRLSWNDTAYRWRSFERAVRYAARREHRRQTPPTRSHEPPAHGIQIGPQPDAAHGARAPNKLHSESEIVKDTVVPRRPIGTGREKLEDELFNATRSATTLVRDHRAGRSQPESMPPRAACVRSDHHRRYPRLQQSSCLFQLPRDQLEPSGASAKGRDSSASTAEQLHVHRRTQSQGGDFHVKRHR